MKQLRKLAFVAVLGTLLAASALAQSGPVYLRSNTALPWNVTANEEAMDMVFGADSWIYGRYETVDANWLFSSTVTLIFMEGGDNNANALSAFLTANADALNSWVEAGGRLLINAAPN